ncbi:MAG: SDR family oxidoreductase [Vallitalea sp.]|jgi:NADH dehydrogenase|nr:SDR family oxidoreductase [Vallitalea sp.]
MNIFVTGASGLVGQSLIKKLEQCNNINKVYCLYRNKPINIQSDKIIPIMGDINSLSTMKIEDNISIVIHLVGYWQKENYNMLNKINVDGTKSCIKFCKNNNINKIIYLSTINVNLMNKGNYAKTKLMAEEEIIKSDLSYIIMRPTLIYGNEDIGLSKLCKLIKKSKFIPVIGNGKALEQPIYVKEVAEYIIEAINNFHENITIPIAGKEAMEYDVMINTLASYIGKNIKIVHFPLKLIRFGAKVLEICKLPSPINNEQIAHISEDLNVDNKIPHNYYNVKLNPFIDNLSKINYIHNT